MGIVGIIKQFGLPLIAVAIAQLNGASLALAQDKNSEGAQPNDSVAAEALWTKFQAAVQNLAPAPKAEPSAAPSLPQAGSPADVTVLRDGIYRLQFTVNGRTEVRNIHLPVALGKLNGFHPNYAQIAFTGNRVSQITLVEAAGGQEVQKIRKIMISLTDEEGFAANQGDLIPSHCSAALYPSGGSFYALPVLLGQSCGDIVSNPSSTYVSAL